MKRIIYLLILSIFIGSCTATYYVKKGNYEKAFEKSIKKLRKKHTHEKSILALKKSYHQILKTTNDRISYLKKQNRDDVYSEIFDHYNHLKYLQEELETVLPLRLNGRNIDFPHTDYDDQMIKAKKKAADFYFNHGNQMLEKGDKFSARIAYKDFTDLKNFFPNYKNIDALLEEALQQGTSHVVIELENKTFFRLSDNFMNDLLPRNLSKLNKDWQNWHESPRKSFDDYEVKISLVDISLSPGLEKENNYTELKEIEDGWEYELDEDGNVKKDSLGNDIKVPKIVELKAYVKEFLQRREGHTHVEILFYDLQTNQRIKKIPADVVFFFENRFATVSGDLEAASKATRRLMRNRPIPFPSDVDMLELSKEPLRERVEDLIRQNRKVID